MKPPSAEWRAWIYGAAWLTGGIALTGLSIWMVSLIRYDWPRGTELKRLDILGIALYMLLTGPLLVMIGLGLRNAIRTIKGTAAGASLEVSGHETDDAPGEGRGT
jgi:hypothetical protein